MTQTDGIQYHSTLHFKQGEGVSLGRLYRRVPIDDVYYESDEF